MNRHTSSTVFDPLKKACGEPVAISTWGLSDAESMREIVASLSRSRVAMLVGYNKRSHNLKQLLEDIRHYRSIGWDVRELPGFHIKMWIVGKKAYAGSCNFAPSTIINEMWSVPHRRTLDLFKKYWGQSAAISRSTMLELVPQAKDRHDGIQIPTEEEFSM